MNDIDTMSFIDSIASGMKMYYVNLNLRERRDYVLIFLPLRMILMGEWQFLATRNAQVTI